ncbi:UDP-glucose/GDP-mannose dehydrogenase family, NAD binding domain-containing protein [Astrocystis sublimbata]|nr:UDP-glucose/GDP-mannose dehydrogenase family, NAD binding domain-containing protein [Astrocystis sublimbata]
MEKYRLPKITKICCIGGGFVGGPTATVIANRCPHIYVTVVDRDIDRITAWQSNELPISEPDLLDVLQVPRDGLRPNKVRNLSFTTDLDNSVRDADIIFIAVDTPTKSSGEGAGSLLETAGVEAIAKSIARVSTNNKIVVDKSTVPIGTSRRIREILHRDGCDGVQFEVLSNPEFLAEGTAVHDLLFPDRVIIGSLEEPSGILAAEALASVYATWVPRSRIVFSNLFSSELSKLAANALLAQRVSSINALSVICEATGADIDQIAKAVGSDSRIGPHMLQSSFGFGGSCFSKDIRSLVYLCESLHMPEVALYWKSILVMNEVQKTRTIPRVTSLLGGDIRGKRIAFLGVAFKKNTADTRESCAIDLIKGFAKAGALITIYDPWVTANRIRHDLGIGDDGEGDPGPTTVKICKSAEEACERACAVLVTTDWDMFTRDGQSTGEALLTEYVDWSRLATAMEHPKVVLGSTQTMDRVMLEEMGFLTEIIGTQRLS